MAYSDQQFKHSLIFLTNRLGRLLGNEARKRMNTKVHGLMPHHIGILADLWQKDGLRQQELVVSVIKDKATIARAIASMEQSNIVVRVPDERDKRYKRIYLTHKGRALQKELVPSTTAIEEEIMQQLDKEEYETCLKVLEEIYKILLK